jgi:hypothetical protein
VVALHITGAMVGVFYDDGIYLALARSLAEGHGYRLLYLPGQPGSVTYPFLYPLFLAALWKIAPTFPANVALFKAANAVLLGCFAGLLVLYLRRSLGGRTWGWAALVAASATVVPLVIVATVLFSEPLFLVLLVAACWVGDLAREAATRRRALLLALLAGALAGAATLARSVGIVIVVAVPLSLALVRRPRAAAVAAAAALACLAPWALWVARHHADLDPVLVANYGTYSDILAQAGWAILSPAGLGEFFRPMSVVALALFHGWLRPYLALPALVLLVAGFVPLLMRAPALGWTILGYIAVILAWPYRPDRFVFTVWPVLSVVFVLGSARLWRRLAGASSTVTTLGRCCVAATVAAVAAGYGFYQVRGYLRGDATRLQDTISASLAEALPWIRQSTPPDAVIAGEDEAHIWLYTGRRAVPSYLWRYRGRGDESLSADAVHDWLLRSGATYVVLAGSGSQAARPLSQVLGEYPGFLRVVRSWPGSMLAFEVMRGAAGASRVPSP